MDHVAKVFYQEDCDLSLLYGKISLLSATAVRVTHTH